MSMSHSNIPIARSRPSSEERERKHTLRSAPIHSPHFFLPKHRDSICSMCNKTSLTNELRDISDGKKALDNNKSSRSYLENVPRLPKIRAPRRMHMRPSKPSYPKVENKFATFVLPHRPIPRSFTIHPEWD